jgi:large subunit ribosomal protein L19
MSTTIDKVRQGQVRQDIPAFRSGDTIRVHVRLKEAEGEKERIQPFEGVVICKRGQSAGATFTVRRVSFGIGVERIFPMQSPSISSIEVLHQGRVRRAKLYYLRGLKGKSARIKRVERVVLPSTAAAAVAAAESKA